MWYQQKLYHSPQFLLWNVVQASTSIIRYLLLKIDFLKSVFFNGIYDWLETTYFFYIDFQFQSEFAKHILLSSSMFS